MRARPAPDRVGSDWLADDMMLALSILAPQGREAAVIQGVLDRAGVKAVCIPTLADLIPTIAEAAGIVVTEETLTGPDLPALLAAVASQPAWSDLSFLVLATKQSRPRSATQVALLQALGNTLLLERPLDADTLVRAATSAIRARARQLSARELNATLEQRMLDRTAAARQSEAELRAMFDSFPESLFLVNATADGPVFEHVNPAAEAVIGRPAADVLGRTVSQTLPPQRAAVLELNVARCLQTGSTVRYVSEIAGPLADGLPERVLDFVLTPIPGEGPKLSRVMGVARDVTARSLLEVKLRQAQKMEAVGQLTGGVAHDFNNLLQVVVGGLALLERAQDAARRSQLIESIRRAALRGGELTKRLLTVARRQQLRPAPLDLRTWLDAGAGELMTRALRGDIATVVMIALDLPPVLVDAAELELALLNIAVNAREAMPSGGTVRVTAAPVSLSVDGDPDGLHGAFVQLAIADTGVGMDAATQARVFEPFFTTKEIGQGTGLGLAQVYGFARQSGGSVRLTSQAGKGTTVTLLLPVSAESLATPPQKQVAVPDGASGYSILVCEDDEDVAALVVDLLRQLGHTPTRVAGAVAAVNILSQDWPCDLLFTDVLMPGGMDGLALAREVRRHRPGLPVLLTTGYAGGGAADVPLGVPLLRKPYRIEQLQSAIDRTMTAALA